MIDDARHRILAAAARVYAQHGWRGATTRRIADEAGVNEVTLFRQFGSKDALLATAMIMALGLELMWLGMTLASQIMRFFTSQDIMSSFTTEFCLFDPARQVPCGCRAPEVVTNRLICCCSTCAGSFGLGKLL